MADIRLVIPPKRFTPKMRQIIFRIFGVSIPSGMTGSVTLCCRPSQLVELMMQRQEAGLTHVWNDFNPKRIV